MQVVELRALLQELLESSKAYFNFTAKGCPDSGEYVSKIWTFRGASKDKARVLALKADIEERYVAEIIDFLRERQLIDLVRVDSGETTDEYVLLMPAGVEMYRTLPEDAEAELSEEEMAELAAEAWNGANLAAYREMLNRVQEPLLESDLGAKSAVFALFLLLMGAAAKKNALMVRTDENKEIEFQEEIVGYLNALAGLVFPSSHAAKGKRFVVGELSNFIRRSKELKEAYNALFKRDPDALYFDVTGEDGAISRDLLEKVVRITVDHLSRHASEDDDLAASLPGVVTQYTIGSPLKQAHRTALFGERPDFGYGLLLTEVVRAVLNEAEDSGAGSGRATALNA